MNPDTRVSIHCYAGDSRQAEELLPIHLRHECPVTVLSPVDAPVGITHSDVDTKFVGYRQYLGERAIQRQREQMKTLLSYPENFFLMHDADSVCVSPKLPDYLYNEPNVLWSNLVYIDGSNEQPGCDAQDLPRLAFQPPYFMSRRTIEAMLATTDEFTGHFDRGVDHWFVKTAINAGVVYKGFPDGMSAPISTEPGVLEEAYVRARHKGFVFFHAVKAPVFWQPLVTANQKWSEDFRGAGDFRSMSEQNTTANVTPDPQEYVRVQWTPDRTTYFRKGEDLPPPPPEYDHGTGLLLDPLPPPSSATPSVT